MDALAYFRTKRIQFFYMRKQLATDLFLVGIRQPRNLCDSLFESFDHQRYLAHQPVPPARTQWRRTRPRAKEAAPHLKENKMSIQRFDTGPRMSQVVIHGDTVYLAGVVANNAGGESVTKQTQDVLKTIDGHLKKAGSDKSKLLSATIYLTDMKTFAEMNAVWDGWVSAGNTPARATVEAKLASPQYGVEIMVIAAR
jgi:enamine deaminase RidA (YjgF/YER057c/UK114 family)